MGGAISDTGNAAGLMGVAMDPRFKIGMRIVKTALAAGICLQVFYWLNLGSNINGVYAAVAATICMKTSLQQTVRTGIDRTVGTVIGSVVGTLFLLLSRLVPESFFALIATAGVIFVIYLCNIFKLQLSVVISVVVYLVILVVPRDIPPLLYGVARLGETLFGIFVALAVNKFFDFRYIRSKLTGTNDKPEASVYPIRSHTGKDLGRIMQIWLAANIQAHKRIYEDYWHEQYDDAREAIKSAFTLVFESDGIVSGFISLASDNQIFSLCVAQQFRQAGIGTRLLDALKSQYPCLGVLVYEGNECAMRFFLHRGFIVLSETRNDRASCRVFSLGWSDKGKGTCVLPGNEGARTGAG